MKKLADYGRDDHPADDLERAQIAWAVAVLDDCDGCDDVRVELTMEEVGRPGSGLVAHLAPETARRLRTALTTALREAGEDLVTAHTIEVQEQGMRVAFSFQEMLRFSGPGSPGGVALGLKMMERAFALLEPDGLVERREVVVETAFRGPGARDACELVTRGLTEARYVVDPALERPDRGHTLRTFCFRVSYRNRAVSLVLREGFVTDEFVQLAQSSDLTAEEQQHFASMKQALASQLMATNAADVFDVE